jgi:hypothetical protein
MGNGMGLRRCLLSALLLLASAGQVFAEGFRCPKTDRLVELGYLMKAVVAKCGPPASREDFFENDCSEGNGCYLVRTGEIWTYDFGPSYLTRILYFRGVSLFKVEEGMYGR